MLAKAIGNLLLVDDEQDILSTMETFLTGEGLNVRTALNGREALNSIESDPPDLVVTDIRMPGIDGIELLKMIKEQDRSIQVIVISGYTDLKAVHSLVSEHDAVGFMHKPFEDIDRFLGMVQEGLIKREKALTQSNDSNL